MGGSLFFKQQLHATFQNGSLHHTEASKLPVVSTVADGDSNLGDPPSLGEDWERLGESLTGASQLNRFSSGGNSSISASSSSALAPYPDIRLGLWNPRSIANKLLLL